MNTKDLSSYMPLTEATYFILVSLINPNHGYGIMQLVDEITKGRVKLGPGTLYGALNKLLKEDLIERVGEDDSDRKKIYVVTKRGKELVELEFLRLKDLVNSTEPIVNSNKLIISD